LITWTIGGGGLLGTALRRQNFQHFESTPIPWDDTEAAVEAIELNAKRFREVVNGEDWAVIWAAGNAANASTQTEAAKELRTLKATVSALKENKPQGRGALFLSSSAGGVYAGSQGAPFTELSDVHPLSPYGDLKLAQEQAAAQELAGICPVIIGRISNLYGTGQNLEKLQGLISRLALSAITKQQVNMFVSLDTIRDYIYADDAAAVIRYSLERAVQNGTNSADIQIIASGHPVSLGYLIHLMQDISRTKIPVAYGSHASSSSQSRDLRLRPSNETQTHHFIQTPLAVGAKKVYLDILERFQQAK
jgi:UDP-glucose 4-epimerase